MSHSGKSQLNQVRFQLDGLTVLRTKAFSYMAICYFHILVVILYNLSYSKNNVTFLFLTFYYI